MELKISVFIVSYNQKKFIEQAIRSVVEQSFPPYEVVISDDCSTDGTWEIIQKYADLYPQLIRASRNEPNIGLFQNFNKATHLTTGNLVTCVAGDDFIKEGYFEAVEQCVKRENLNPDKDSFILIPNIIKLLKTGEELKHNNYKLRNEPVIKLIVRGLLDDRYGVVSRKSLNKTTDFIENIGIHADYVWAIDRALNTDKFAFIDGYYSVYREGIGVSAIHDKQKEIESSKSWVKALSIILDRYRSELGKRDIQFIKYQRAKYEYLACRSFKTYSYLFLLTVRNLGNFSNWRKICKAFVFLFLLQSVKKVLFKIKALEKLSK